jgi:hypothetical protein
MMKLLAALAFSTSLIFSHCGAAAQDTLPRLGASASDISVSGFSSGAFMAVQYQVAFSASVIGAGIVAGGPYDCAKVNLFSITTCMGYVTFFPPNAQASYDAAKKDSDEHKIDTLDNLQKSRIYVFSGTKDAIMWPQAVQSTVKFFLAAGVPQSNIAYVNNVPAGHALVTPRFGNPCMQNASPYISHCTVKNKSYDQVGAIFAHIYGSLKPPAKTLSGHIQRFDQREFLPPNTGMADYGFVYVPASCSSGVSCRVHVAFHGCEQSFQFVNDDFYGKTTYNAWADANNLIVLYPQVDRWSQPINPAGCWDWVGYSSDDYAIQSAPQMKAVHDMVERLTESTAATARR